MAANMSLPLTLTQYKMIKRSCVELLGTIYPVTLLRSSETTFGGYWPRWHHVESCIRVMEADAIREKQFWVGTAAYMDHGPVLVPTYTGSRRKH